MARGRKKSTGAKRMREQGYVRCDVWLPPTWAAMVRSTATSYGVPLATFLRLLALAYAATAVERTDIRYQLQSAEWRAWYALCTVIPAKSIEGATLAECLDDDTSLPPAVRKANRTRSNVTGNEK